MQRIFAIGDIHGCNDAFHRMLFTEIKIRKTDAIYCIGDYIDRGPDSREVVDTVLSLRQQGFRIHTLRGNHEQMMMDSVESEINFSLWYNNGGGITLKSFGADSYSSLAEPYRQFFRNTKYYIKTAEYIFVHAGLNFEREDIFEDRAAMLWIRSFAPQQDVLGKKLLIHGHTPQSLNQILNQEGNCLNIDGGCVYNHKKDLGNLVALSLPEKKFIIVDNKTGTAD